MTRAGPGTKHVGIWIRVSTEDQAKGESPEHHERRARAYVESKDWIVQDLYRLDAVSGKSVMGHSEAQRMLEDIRSGRITGLIFSKLARLARNTRELLDFADIFREHGADLISLQESIDTSTPAGRLFYTMIAAMAQWEREEIAERVAASIPIRAKLGKSLGGHPTFGYRLDGHQLVPDPKEAPVRRLIHELFLEHKRIKAVARILNERGYRTRKGQPFSPKSIHRYLEDPTAKGIRRVNYTRATRKGGQAVLKPEEEWITQSVEPIVPPEIWDQCAALLGHRKVTKTVPGRTPIHLFTGLAYCACGQRMYVKWQSPKYHCVKCRTKIRADDLEAIFREQLRAFVVSPEDVLAYLGQADQEIKSREERLAGLEAEAAKVQAEIDRAFRLYVDQSISGDGFKHLNDPLEERRIALAAETPRLRGELDFLKIEFLSKDEVLASGRDLYERWPSLNRQEQRAIVEALLQRLVVGKDEVEIELACAPGFLRNPGRKVPIPTGCAPTPGGVNGCTTGVSSTTWGAIKRLYR